MTSYNELNLPEYEQLVECPYNKAHQIIKHRFQCHLIRCRRSHALKVKMVPCRYNAVHLYPEPELKAHEAICENRIDVLRFLYDDGNKKKSKPVEASFAVPSTLSDRTDEESWDNDEAVPSYNPRENCAKSNVIQHIQHMTPSQREAVRQAERERLRNFQK